ncbi:hypothetical protein [Pectinatus haikarae]|uniref:Uncharacterized protein n=1 Tax=Pectinatus haikarae TaxID=349096 RepID=A0ABT9Y5F5_9FIRM|nr:hypothetical protein [Pectinatus haikarae]MDQ0203058.1 hypothetical protein [Pectinatus haikarae]
MDGLFWKKQAVNSFEILLLIFILPLSFILPDSFAWENGPLESTQVIVLVAAALINFYFFYKRRHNFQLTISGFFLLLTGRELNWGRCFFPLGIGPDGPILVPMNQIPHHAIINIIIGIFIMVVLAGFIFTTPWYKIFSYHLFPVKLLVYSCICTLFSITGDSGHFFGKYKGELLEELGELLLYLLLLHISLYYYIQSSNNN